MRRDCTATRRQAFPPPASPRHPTRRFARIFIGRTAQSPSEGELMQSNVILFGWNRSAVGREKVSAAHFQEFVAYATGLQQKGHIESCEAIFLDQHGGDLNGFFLIKGEPSKLDAVMASREWITHMTRAMLHLEGSGVIRGAAGDAVMQRMALWGGLIPA
jgi:hypothetical protein